MSAEAQFVLTVLLGSAVLVAARRWKNTDPTAGAVIAGWAIAAIVFYAIGQSK